MNRNYYILLAAYFISSVGDWLYKLAIPILVYQLTKSPLAMSIVFAITFLPFLFVSPFGGVFADRLNRRKILIWGDFLSFLLILLIGIIVNTHSTNATIIYLYILIALAAIVSPIYHPAFQGIIPSLIKDKTNLSKANSLISSSDNIIMSIAPLIGGGIIALVGIVNAIYLNAISFLISSILIIFIDKATQNFTPSQISIKSILADLKAGFNFAWAHPVLKYGALLFIFTNFAVNIFFANFMYYLIHLLNLSASQIGGVFAIIGIGSLGGAILAPKLIKLFSSGRLISYLTILAGLLTFLLLATSNPWLVAIIWGSVCACGSINVVTYFTLRQQAVPSEYLGRSVAITRLISYSSIPLASILGGWLLGMSVSIYVLIFICAIIRFLVGILAWLSPLGQYK